MGPLPSRPLLSLMFVTDTGVLCPCSLFLAFSVYLSFAVSGWGETEVGSSCSVLRDWGSWLLILLSFSQQEEVSWAGCSLLALGSGGLGNGMMHEK